MPNKPTTTKKVFKLFKPYKMPWWKRIILFFVKPSIGYDLGNDIDKAVVTVFKRWRGIIYVIDQYEVGKDL